MQLCLQNWHIVSIFINVQSSSITTDFTKFHLYTDFRNYSSLAQLQAVWWTWQTVMWWSPTISYWSSWVTISWNSFSYWWVYAELPFTINSSHKINMKFTWYLRWTNKCWLWLWSTSKLNLQDNNSHEIWYAQNSWWSRNDQWVTTAKYVNWTKYRWTFDMTRTQTWSEWEFSAEIQIDLPNNTIKWISYAPNSQIWSMEWQLNTEWFNSIVWTKYFIPRLMNYESPKSLNIYTAEITIK